MLSRPVYRSTPSSAEYIPRLIVALQCITAPTMSSTISPAVSRPSPMARWILRGNLSRLYRCQKPFLLLLTLWGGWRRRKIILARGRFDTMYIGPVFASYILFLCGGLFALAILYTQSSSALPLYIQYLSAYNISRVAMERARIKISRRGHLHSVPGFFSPLLCYYCCFMATPCLPYASPVLFNEKMASLLLPARPPTDFYCRSHAFGYRGHNRIC